MKLYGTPPTRVIRVLWLLNELGLECEMVPVDLRAGEHRTDRFLAINPAGKVPVLVDGEVVLTESAAIALYLAEKCPDQGLIPQNLGLRAQMYRWIFFLVTEIEQPLWRMARHSSIYPEEQRLPADVKLAASECKQMAAVLEEHMRGREFLVGDGLTVADLLAAYTLDWAGQVKLLEQCPNLKAFVARMYARPTAPPTIAEAFAALQS
ncbi:MAG: glutathione S-transferase family protein [Vulcanimicrobiota bacterium]